MMIFRSDTKLWLRRYHSTAFVEWTRHQPCAVCGSQRSVECAHVAKSKGAGGTWRDCCALCTQHHESQHRAGVRTFERMHGVRLAALAQAHAARWLAGPGQHLPDPLEGHSEGAGAQGDTGEQ